MSQENRRMRRAFNKWLNSEPENWCERVSMAKKMVWYRDDSQRRFDERCEADQRHEQSLHDAGLVRTISAAENDCMNEINGFEDDPAQHSS